MWSFAQRAGGERAAFIYQRDLRSAQSASRVRARRWRAGGGTCRRSWSSRCRVCCRSRCATHLGAVRCAHCCTECALAPACRMGERRGSPKGGSEATSFGGLFQTPLPENQLHVPCMGGAAEETRMQAVHGALPVPKTFLSGAKPATGSRRRSGRSSSWQRPSRVTSSPCFSSCMPCDEGASAMRCGRTLCIPTCPARLASLRRLEAPVAYGQWQTCTITHVHSLSVRPGEEQACGVLHSAVDSQWLKCFCGQFEQPECVLALR